MCPENIIYDPNEGKFRIESDIKPAQAFIPSFIHAWNEAGVAPEPDVLKSLFPGLIPSSKRERDRLLIGCETRRLPGGVVVVSTSEVLPNEPDELVDPLMYFTLNYFLNNPSPKPTEAIALTSWFHYITARPDAQVPTIAGSVMNTALMDLATIVARTQHILENTRVNLLKHPQLEPIEHWQKIFSRFSDKQIEDKLARVFGQWQTITPYNQEVLSLPGFVSMLYEAPQSAPQSNERRVTDRRPVLTNHPHEVLPTGREKASTQRTQESQRAQAAVQLTMAALAMARRFVRENPVDSIQDEATGLTYSACMTALTKHHTLSTHDDMDGEALLRSVMPGPLTEDHFLTIFYERYGTDLDESIVSVLGHIWPNDEVEEDVS